MLLSRLRSNEERTISRWIFGDVFWGLQEAAGSGESQEVNSTLCKNILFHLAKTIYYFSVKTVTVLSVTLWTSPLFMLPPKGSIFGTKEVCQPLWNHNRKWRGPPSRWPGNSHFCTWGPASWFLQPAGYSDCIWSYNISFFISDLTEVIWCVEKSWLWISSSIFCCLSLFLFCSVHDSIFRTDQ